MWLDPAFRDRTRAHDYGLTPVEAFAIYFWSLASNALQFALIDKEGHAKTSFIELWKHYLHKGCKKLPKRTEGETFRGITVPTDVYTNIIQVADSTDHIVRLLALSATSPDKKIAYSFLPK